MDNTTDDTYEKHISSRDWNEVHRKLAKVRRDLQRESTPEERKTILKERAVRLAKEEKEEEIPGDSFEVVEFVLAYEKYAIESAFVREIYPLTTITPLPGIPSFVRGIIHFRGQILSIIDLKKFFELPEKGLTDLNKIIIIRNATMEFGILADAVTGIGRISPASIEADLPTFTGIRARYLKGITGGQVIILDANKLLSDDSIVIAEGRETH